MPRSNECEDGQTVFLSSSDCLAAPLRHNISLWLRFRSRGHCVVSILRFNDAGWAMPTPSIHEVDVASDGEWIPSDCHEMDRPNHPVTHAKLIPLRSQIFKSHFKREPSGTTRTWCEMGEISASLLLLLLNFATFPPNLCPFPSISICSTQQALFPSLALSRIHPSHPICRLSLSLSVSPSLLLSRIIGVANLTLWSAARSLPLFSSPSFHCQTRV